MEELKIFSKRKVLYGSMLIAGVAIGAGMLALPLASAEAGFWPACMIYLFCWLFSTITGLFMAEISLSLPQKEGNLVSMAKHYLGPFGQVVAWVLYLFLFYLLTIAYISGGGQMINSSFFSGSAPLTSFTLFTFVFALVVFLGHGVVSRVNLILMLGLILSYGAFLFLGLPKIDISSLKEMKWGSAISALPVVFTSFSYQGTVPSLCVYLKKNRKMIRHSILIGSSIPFIVYILWDFMIKGLSPVGSLLEARQAGLSAIAPLHDVLKGAPVTRIAELFGFFALTTSFLGVTLGLLDFLADGLNLKNTGFRRVLLSLLVFVPPLLVASIDPHLFFVALKFAGGIGCVLLLGLLPTLMIWVGRYVKKELKSVPEVRGGRGLLFFLLLFMLFEIGVTLL
jgi:tyrosine-specific transport protein